MEIKPQISYAHTYLCGHLKTRKSADEVAACDARWTRVIMTTEEYQATSNIYYESFVDSLVEVKGRKQQDFYKGTAYLRMDVKTPCTLHDDRFGEQGWTFELCALHLFFFPYNICLFAIEIEEQAGSDPDKLSYAHGLLRETNDYEQYDAKSKSWVLSLNAPGYTKAIEPLLHVCGVSGGEGATSESRYANLTCTGNKLKAFQIFGVSELSDSLLYELGSTSPVGCVDDSSHSYSPAPSYYEKIMAENTISVFKNWKALALLDSLTVIQLGGTERRMWLWRESYFRLIYIHAYYQKTLLFVVNNLFRSDAANGECTSILQQMKQQEHWYAFSNISYNFLPQMIYKAIDSSLEIASERTQLHHYLVQEAERQEALNERRVGKLLSVLTVLTVLSALYDGTTLICETLGFATGGHAYRWVLTALCGIVVLIFGWWLCSYYTAKNQRRS